MSTYSELLRDPRWQRRRNEILILDDYACVLCGNAKDNLQVHHCRYRKGAMPWAYPDHELITTCEPCHQKLSGKIERQPPLTKAPTDASPLGTIPMQECHLMKYLIHHSTRASAMELLAPYPGEVLLVSEEVSDLYFKIPPNATDANVDEALCWFEARYPGLLSKLASHKAFNYAPTKDHLEAVILRIRNDAIIRMVKWETEKVQTCPFEELDGIKKRIEQWEDEARTKVGGDVNWELWFFGGLEPSAVPILPDRKNAL